MNFLAHIYLSGENDLLKIGNFMADSIRGSKYLSYPKDIQKGVLLHRHIDSFTDFHPIYRKSKHRLHEKYGHYSGVIMDIMYDHFLSKNWNAFSEIPLEKYAASFYELLQKEESLLTERTKNMIAYMIAQNWLVSYASLEGLETTLFQMNYRTKNRVNMPEAMKELKQFETEFESEFFAFFEELQLSCQQKLIELETY
jgi:acyl carrier protein phosphodiesterase